MQNPLSNFSRDLQTSIIQETSHIVVNGSKKMDPHGHRDTSFPSLTLGNAQLPKEHTFLTHHIDIKKSIFKENLSSTIMELQEMIVAFFHSICKYVSEPM